MPVKVSAGESHIAVGVDVGDCLAIVSMPSSAQRVPGDNLIGGTSADWSRSGSLLAFAARRGAKFARALLTLIAFISALSLFRACDPLDIVLVAMVVAAVVLLCRGALLYDENACLKSQYAHTRCPFVYSHRCA